MGNENTIFLLISLEYEYNFSKFRNYFETTHVHACMLKNQT